MACHFAVLALCVSCTAHEEGAVEPSIEEGEKAMMALNPQRAEEMFARVFRDEAADPEDRAEAGQKLARLIWHLYGRLDEARQTLETTRSFDREPFQSYLVASGIELQAGNYRAARDSAHAAVTAARSRYETHDADVAFARAYFSNRSIPSEIPRGKYLSERLF